MRPNRSRQIPLRRIVRATLSLPSSYYIVPCPLRFYCLWCPLCPYGLYLFAAYRATDRVNTTFTPVPRKFSTKHAPDRIGGFTCF